MPQYDATRFDPPAPIAIVSLRLSGSNVLVNDVPLLIDSGADVTLLPRAAVARLGVAPQAGAPVELIGFDGTRSTADAVELDMLFLNKAFRGRYLIIDDEYGILGRDVLNALRLLLDGPGGAWSELKAPPSSATSA